MIRCKMAAARMKRDRVAKTQTGREEANRERE